VLKHLSGVVLGLSILSFSGVVMAEENYLSAELANTAYYSAEEDQNGYYQSKLLKAKPPTAVLNGLHVRTNGNLVEFTRSGYDGPSGVFAAVGIVNPKAKFHSEADFDKASKKILAHYASNALKGEDYSFTEVKRGIPVEVNGHYGYEMVMHDPKRNAFMQITRLWFGEGKTAVAYYYFPASEEKSPKSVNEFLGWNGSESYRQFLETIDFK